MNSKFLCLGLINLSFGAAVELSKNFLAKVLIIGLIHNYPSFFKKRFIFKKNKIYIQERIYYLFELQLSICLAGGRFCKNKITVLENFYEKI